VGSGRRSPRDADDILGLKVYFYAKYVNNFNNTQLSVLKNALTSANIYNLKRTPQSAKVTVTVSCENTMGLSIPRDVKVVSSSEHDERKMCLY